MLASPFNVTRTDLKAALTGWGDHRIKNLIKSPKPLLFVSKLGATGGGRPIEHFQIADLVPRLREKDVSQEAITALIDIDAKRRHHGETANV